MGVEEERWQNGTGCAQCAAAIVEDASIPACLAKLLDMIQEHL